MQHFPKTSTFFRKSPPPSQMDTTQEQDEYVVDLCDQRYFGAGLKRKRVQFVPSTTAATQSTSLPATPKESSAKKYLNIVFKDQAMRDRAASPPADEHATISELQDGNSATNNVRRATSTEAPANTEMILCDVCHLPIRSSTRQHETSLAHQVCLAHSHPPSSLDRSRRGLNILQEQGWNPDSRLGLGASGEGRLYPVKPVEKTDRAGVGSRRDSSEERERKVRGGLQKRRELMLREKGRSMGAREVKVMEREGRKKAEMLRNSFYRSEEVERYLGGG